MLIITRNKPFDAGVFSKHCNCGLIKKKLSCGQIADTTTLLYCYPLAVANISVRNFYLWRCLERSRSYKCCLVCWVSAEPLAGAQ